jgi:poly-gamma-glutamate synthesis protein (capsule biosynthesis protein)
MKMTIIAEIFLVLFLFFSAVSVHSESTSADYSTAGVVNDLNLNAGVENKKNAIDSSTEESITLLFIGDVMGHISQIRSAKQPDGITYDYKPCFDYIRADISSADLAFANLEVTLAGPPYTGFPQFSTPDALAAACKDAGIDVLFTANNHCVDRGRKGLERTIKILDSLDIPHTGTFLSYSDKRKKTPFIIEKNGFKIALINSTAETNEIPVPKSNYVNVINIDRLKEDIAKAKSLKPDAVILFFHWGVEKEYEPNAGQLKLAEACFNAGADIIIGSHPHVLQKSILVKDPEGDKFIAYSLGNFLANQKAPKTDGGQMIKLKLQKKDGITTISKAEYLLTWIYSPGPKLKKKFYVLPCRDFENRPEFFESPDYYNRMKTFIDESRKLLDSRNENVTEIN